MKIVNNIPRILLGLLLLIFGLNKFFNYLPPFDFGNSTGAESLFNALTASGYMWALVGGVETIVGALLLIKKAMPAALLALVPISVNIVLFHAVLDPVNIGPAILVAGLNTFLIIRNWNYYRSLVS